MGYLLNFIPSPLKIGLIALVLAGLVGLYGWQQIRIGRLERDVARAETDLATSQANVESLKGDLTTAHAANVNLAKAAEEAEARAQKRTSDLLEASRREAASKSRLAKYEREALNVAVAPEKKDCDAVDTRFGSFARSVAAGGVRGQ